MSAARVPAILDTGLKVVRNVGRFSFGAGGAAGVAELAAARRAATGAAVVWLLDEYFATHPGPTTVLGIAPGDHVEHVGTADEPTTDGIDALVARVRAAGHGEPASIVGFGGGITLDTAKALANLLTNGGRAADYQGWDLVRVPGVHKVGVPTISGTGAEATRTCVMTNPATGLKLGMNSDHTVFDHVVLDPDLTRTVPRDQYFFTGMDAYIHCVEALAGSYRNAIGDAYSRETVALCRRVFLEGDMMSDANRSDLMVASYLGGCAIATSYVGVVHPLSAALSVVYGLHHCVANCIVLNALGEFYPEAHAEFGEMVRRQGVAVPTGVCARLDDATRAALVAATVKHEKPLVNALGERFRDRLTDAKLVSIFESM
ncbi:MAG: iron-containing alcohol dehydrogenase family protein [Ilumatobacteraceae bacterium]